MSQSTKVEIPLSNPHAAARNDDSLQSVDCWYVELGHRVFAGQILGRYRYNFHDVYGIRDCNYQQFLELVSPCSGVLTRFITQAGTVEKKGTQIVLEVILDDSMSPPDQPTSFRSPFNGVFKYSAFKDREISDVRIVLEHPHPTKQQHQLNEDGSFTEECLTYHLGSYPRVVEVMQPRSGVPVACGTELFKFFPQSPGVEILKKFDREARSLDAEVHTLKKEKKELKKEIRSLSELRETNRRENLDYVSRAEQEAMATATRKVEAIVAKAQAEADAESQKIKDNAAQLSLEAVVNRLYELQAEGELPNLTERSVLRDLYIAIGEMIAESQGFAAPSTLDQKNHQQKVDDIKAMNESIAAEIRETEARNDWPQQLKDTHIQQLLNLANTKFMAVNRSIKDDG